MTDTKLYIITALGDLGWPWVFDVIKDQTDNQKQNLK